MNTSFNRVGWGGMAALAGLRHSGVQIVRYSNAPYIAVLGNLHKGVHSGKRVGWMVGTMGFADE